ncbi:hypothetical protein VTK73DRAFT_3444 [Phialemonium thermophilum]|uniref:Uncharacterized protein n=1 Tax=Phialemonium thermophilum TaxID=223376 RepID=A0ABR3WZV3_9PEZI
MPPRFRPRADCVDTEDLNTCEKPASGSHVDIVVIAIIAALLGVTTIAVLIAFQIRRQRREKREDTIQPHELSDYYDPDELPVKGPQSRRTREDTGRGAHGRTAAGTRASESGEADRGRGGTGDLGASVSTRHLTPAPRHGSPDSAHSGTRLNRARDDENPFGPTAEIPSAWHGPGHDPFADPAGGVDGAAPGIARPAPAAPGMGQPF